MASDRAQILITAVDQTRTALDGLFLVIGEQERAMRQDPLGAATGLARKVFSAL